MYDGTNWVWLGNSYVINTIYSAGTAALIQAGTDTSNRVWQAKILQDEFVSKRGDTMTGNLILNSTIYITSNTITDTSGKGMLFYDGGNMIGAFGNGTTATIPTYIRSTGNNLYHRKGKYSSYTDHLIADAGNISSKDATIGTSLTKIATIAGVDIKAKIDLSSIAVSVSVTKTLNVDSWTNVGGFTGTGTYAIQISCGDLYASGILSGCGGSDTVIDEVPLHVTNKGANTWRPYVRVSGTQLQMTTNEASPGTSREYTIKILKLI
jgi:hypothetical protein